MNCNPENGHNSVCWYQQEKMELKFLAIFHSQQVWLRIASLLCVPQMYPTVAWKVSPQKRRINTEPLCKQSGYSTEMCIFHNAQTSPRPIPGSREHMRWK